MGVTTDFIGHIAIRPSLNASEQQYLTAFSQSRRFDRPAGPYAVPGNPAAESTDRPDDLDAYNRGAPGQPSLWCQWVPSMDGACLAFDGREKFYAATPWMTYLIDHFLTPHAHASTSGLDTFSDFTFDHVLDGVIAASQRDTAELYLIRVENNLVSRASVWSPDLGFRRTGSLPYEDEIDKAAARRRRRR